MSTADMIGTPPDVTESALGIEPLWTRQDMARLLKTTPSIVSEWVRLGYIPRPLRVGRQAFWTPETVRTWLAEREAVARDRGSCA